MEYACAIFWIESLVALLSPDVIQQWAQALEENAMKGPSMHDSLEVED
jgi:hypothetical protein